MKKIISLVVLISSISLAQIEQSKSLTELKQQLAVGSLQSAVNSLQFTVHSLENTSLENFPSTINHLPSTIHYLPSSISKYQSADFQKKNPALAILYSMLLPGMGELYANGFESGKYFTIADGVLWSVFAGFNVYGNWKENNYKSFAESKGGVNLNGKSADYYANIGLYQSVDDYNKAMELNGDFSLTYNNVTHYWKWIDNDQRREYRDMWSSSEQAFNNIRFVVGALILNRLISAINAVRLVAAYNKNLSNEISWNVYINVVNKPTLPATLSLNFISSF